MALPMDEQRILDEMERMLAADDPRLAARLAAFGQPGFGQSLRTRRARATLSVMVLVLIAAVAAVIYLMSVLRPGQASQNQPTHTATALTVTPSASNGPNAPPTASSGPGAGVRAASSVATSCEATFPPRRCDRGTWAP